jgi:competence ComEA-like helix-hairpin-helix protein
MLKQVSEKYSLTATEIKIFLFLIFMLSAGILYKYYSSDEAALPPAEFDYSLKDSIFRAAGNKIIPHNNEAKGEKKFDYKQEVLEFNRQNSDNVKSVKTSAEKSINLNTAGINELITVPGLGTKTAEKIIQYRAEIGSFSNIEQLKEIKGIGTKKFNLIKVYVYID